MEINEAISLAGSIVESVKKVKSVSEAIPRWLFLPPFKAQITELKNQIAFLEKQVISGFPKLEALISSYSYLISEVKVAKALSDKAFEILGFALADDKRRLKPNINQAEKAVAFQFMTTAALDRENEHSRITEAITKLTSIDKSEMGALEQIMKDISQNSVKLKGLKSDDEGIVEARRLHGEISTKYSGMSSIISTLLAKILDSFKILS